MSTLSKKIVILAATYGLSACASIVGGRYQPVSVETRSANQTIVGADCTVSNGRGEMHVTTPGTVMVHRASAPLSISCQKSGAQIAQQSFPSRIRPIVWGNILFGGVIGAVVDFSDGAAHHYPQVVTLMSQMAALPSAAVPASDLASMDPRIGRSMFNAAQNVAANEQCDRAIRVVMADGQHALFKSACPAGMPIKIECQHDQCTSLHVHMANTAI